MHAVITEVLAHRTPGIGRQALHRGRLGRGCGYADGVLHRAVFLERLHHLRHGRALLPDNHIDAVELFGFVDTLPMYGLQPMSENPDIGWQDIMAFLKRNQKDLPYIVEGFPLDFR